MIKLKKPNLNLQVILDNCTENMQEPRKTRINQVKPTILARSIKYDELAEAGELYSVAEHDTVDSIATKDDMEALYTQKFVPDNQENRTYYDKIKLLAPNNKCPYCGQNVVKTIDHYLPKAKYVTYSVTPYNLVPACSDCNRLKSSSTFTSYSEQPIHPYYDDFDDEIWLKAKLVEEEPVTFEFYADPPSSWDTIKRQRIVNNFNKLQLNDIYKIHASELYHTCFNRLRILYNKGGKELAISRLEENVEDESVLRNNSWKAAMYRAMIESDWYWESYLSYDKQNVIE